MTAEAPTRSVTIRPRHPRGYEIALVAAGVASLSGVLAFPSLTGAADVGGEWTRSTIRLALLWYAAATALMLWRSPENRHGAAGLWRTVRACWTIAWVCYLVHLGMAFQYHHHWSHAEAFRHVEQGSGFGPGIFISYAFTLLWSVDVIWWWLRPSGLARRPAWLRRSVYAFLAFVVFNGAVVFAQGIVRWLGVAAFALFAALWLRRYFGMERRGTAPASPLPAPALEASEATIP